MDYKKMAFGLGVFSIALGAAELFASRRIARSLETNGHEGVIKAFGARELLAGVNLLAAPAASVNAWNRVAGDTMDLGALALVAKDRPRGRAIWGAIAFVVGATALDVATARGLDRQTGKLLPT